MTNGVLVLTELFDPTADLVITELNDRGVSVLRVDASDFPRSLNLAADLKGGRWTGSLRTSQRSMALEDIAAVWYRRPSRFTFPHLTEFERRFAAAQARAGLGGILATLPCRWVNHPHAAARAEYKAVQLPTATRCGLEVPHTIVTSVPEVQHRFDLWLRNDRPQAGRFGLTVEPGRQYVWLDSPTSAHRWVL